jgi:predicted dehydrogenase
MTIRAAILGTGHWARTAHLPALVAHPGVTVVACADPNIDLARKAAETFGVPAAYDGLDSMLDNEQPLSLLVIAAPDDVHPTAIRAALSRGVTVFCEKPLANDAWTADALSAQGGPSRR